MDTAAKGRHLLQRLTYGPRPGELDALLAGGESGIHSWLETQLAPETIADPELDARLAPLSTLKMSSTEIRKRYQHTAEFMRDDRIADVRPDDPGIQAHYYDRNIQRILDELRLQRFIRVVHAKAQLNELLFEFWFNHFNVAWGKIPVRWLITSYERDAIRPRMYGKFRDLLSATAHHPAMLEYLDNSVSRAGDSRTATNENYARELMELHTVGVDGGYTQKDVVSLARILTGWTQDEPFTRAEFFFRESWHDSGEKTLLGHVFSGTGGVQEGERAIELLARHPSTARFISNKLARFFISDSPPEALISKVARRFEETDGDLLEVYRALFQSGEFWSETTPAAKTKRPLQFMASAIRALGGRINDGIQEITQTHAPLGQLGEPMYHCEPPTGYRDDPRYWIAPGAMVIRMRTATALSQNKVKGVTVPDRMKGESAHENLLESEARKLLNAEPSLALKRQIASHPAGAAPDAIPWVRALALASPEFQKR